MKYMKNNYHFIYSVNVFIKFAVGRRKNDKKTKIYGTERFKMSKKRKMKYRRCKK